MKKILMYCTFIALAAAFLTHAQSSIEYAKTGLRLCYEIIIPSLFPFFVCSGLLVYSGFAQLLSRLFTPIMLPVFRINGSGAAAFVLGIISGYPLGAVTACSLYENKYLSKTETERLLAFCNNSGPLFILGSVGISLYCSPLIGWILYISHIFAAITVGIVFRFYKSDSHIAPKSSLNQPERNIGEIFSIVMQNSVNSILMVCGTIVFFSVAANLIISKISGQGWYAAALSGLIEFVTGTVGISKSNLDTAFKLALSSLIVGFAGMSVHFQVMGVVSKYDLSLKPYILGKILHGLFAATYTIVAIRFLPIRLPVFGNETLPLDINGGFAMGSLYTISTVLCILAVCLLCGIWIFSAKARKKIS
ncbi:MAG: hypothetical protein N2171_02195 [Clostridia bacterium]|nr:hypothetical protein [Clostridia bacterium]